jgi:hypothetical protein
MATHAIAPISSWRARSNWISFSIPCCGLTQSAAAPSQRRRENRMTAHRRRLARFVRRQGFHFRLLFISLSLFCCKRSSTCCSAGQDQSTV